MSSRTMPPRRSRAFEWEWRCDLCWKRPGVYYMCDVREGHLEEAGGSSVCIVRPAGGLRRLTAGSRHADWGARRSAIRHIANIHQEVICNQGTRRYRLAQRCSVSSLSLLCSPSRKVRALVTLVINADQPLSLSASPLLALFTMHAAAAAAASAIRNKTLSAFAHSLN